jgi:AcrR family transcriptional regulator
MATSNARGRPKKEQPDADTRQLILDAAIAEFREHGFRGAAIANICKRALIANGTFYLHFPNKAELYDELLAGTFEMLAAALAAAQRKNEGLSDAERQRRDIELIVAFAEANSDLLQIAINERGLAQVSLFDLLAQQRAAELDLGRRSGRFRSDLHPVVTAYAETGVMSEVLRWWLTHPGVMPKARLVKELLKISLRITQP